MSDNPRVSILMTLYNRELTLKDSIESVLASTYQNWELVILDDCSQDNSYVIAKEYAEKDSRIKVHRNKSNLGDYPNRNEITRYAIGYYLKYLDSDDMLFPYGLEKMVHYMDSNPQADWGLTDINQDDFNIFPYLVSNNEIYDAHYNIVGNIFTKAPSSLIIKTSFFKKTGGFLTMKGVSDSEYFYRISMNSNLLLMQYGFLWCRGETKGSQSSIHFRNFALHMLYEEIENHYLLKQTVHFNGKAIFHNRNKVRRLKNYIKLTLNGHRKIKEFFELKEKLFSELNKIDNLIN